MKYKNLIILLVVVLVVVIVVLSYYFSFPEGPSISYLSLKTQAGIVPPKATGNIDDAADALLRELDDLELLFIEEEDDVELLIADEQEISDFGQSIDESEL